MKDTTAQRNYKDTMFRMLFSEKENLLSLYNALNGTSYTDTGGLRVTTLENAVYMNYKNDISFVFGLELMLYEHQSTFNPNMPLRNLFYAAKVIQGITKDEDLYGPRPVRIPAPRFAVFFNGTQPQPEQQTLKLSDAFEGEASDKGRLPELELTVTVYNINLGYNSKLMEDCHVLKEYAQYVNQVREYARRMEFREAVEEAVEYCMRNGILEEFLSKNRAEAIEVSIFEYNEEMHIKNEKEFSYQEGHKSGLELGIRQGIRQEKERITLLQKNLLYENRMEDLRRSIEDEEYREKLYTEYEM